MFDKMLPSYERKMQSETLSHDAFDWALHAGGEAIISGVQETMQLSSHQLRATREIYRTRGNSSSPTVLIVLDELRTRDDVKDHVVATSFGPGLAIEMAFLRRCRGGDDVCTALEALKYRRGPNLHKEADVVLCSLHSN
jgi:type III polyketide synthase